jgi:hypothetical protein
MGRLNLERLMTFSDGSYLTISTECSKHGEFSCTMYSAVETDDHTAFRIISNHLLSADTCMSAQGLQLGTEFLSARRRADEETAVPDLAWATDGSSPVIGSGRMPLFRLHCTMRTETRRFYGSAYHHMRTGGSNEFR